MIYNVSMKIQHLMENEQAVQVLQNTLPGLLKMVQGNPQALTLSVEQLIRYSRVPQADMLLGKLDAALQELNTPENAISPSEAKQIAFFREIWQQEQQLPPKEKNHHQDAIYPGEPWLDTKGERIQAHGGAVYYENGTYYWYGENKTYTDGKNGIWTWGLKVYASQDLCNWDDFGYLIPPVLDDPNCALFPTKRVDRPHILKCPKTGKYVCWIKLSGPEAAFTIWQADNLLGPYEMIENLYNPGGHKAGDFDMVADRETGKGYIYFDADHKSMLCMSLTEDYLHADAESANSYPNMTPPFTREAPALFEAKGRKYMITSGRSGYTPNQSEYAQAENWTDVFVSTGDPHVGDDTLSSFNSQISQVFKVPGKEDLYIAIADRWMPDHLLDRDGALAVRRTIGSKYMPDRFQATAEDHAYLNARPDLERANTRIADYVWLPVHFVNEQICIPWHDTWQLSDYEDSK